MFPPIPLALCSLSLDQSAFKKKMIVSLPLAEGDGAGSSAEGGKQMVVHCSVVASCNAARLTAAVRTRPWSDGAPGLRISPLFPRRPFTRAEGRRRGPARVTSRGGSCLGRWASGPSG